jgi:cytochrome c oxidase subunit III
MSLKLQFTGDLSGVPTHAFGARALTWWGTLAFMVIEGAAFAMAFAAYFFIMSVEDSWPPEARARPDLFAGTLFTVLILASEYPNAKIKKAAEKYDLETVRRLLPLMAGIGIALLVVRVFEFPSLNVSWTDNAYGSILWALLFLHTLHIVTDWGDTAVLAALSHTSDGEEPRRMVDISENSLYWRFVWLSWLPIYVLIYWLPRWAA